VGKSRGISSGIGARPGVGQEQAGGKPGISGIKFSKPGYLERAALEGGAGSGAGRGLVGESVGGELGYLTTLREAAQGFPLFPLKFTQFSKKLAISSFV